MSSRASSALVLAGVLVWSGGCGRDALDFSDAGLLDAARTATGGTGGRANPSGMDPGPRGGTGGRPEGSGGGSAVKRVKLAFLPEQLDFGDVVVDAESKEAIVTLRNVGDVSATLPEFTTAGSDAFLVRSVDCRAIGPGDKCGVGVTFKPPAIGRHAAKLNAVLPLLAESTPALLTGRGIPQAPALSIRPNAYDFGVVRIGDVSPPVVLSVVNIGRLRVEEINVRLDGAANFGVFNRCDSLPPGASCALVVSFKPAVLGLQDAKLLVEYPGSNEVVALRGTGQR
jgi:hypothetical protein